MSAAGNEQSAFAIDAHLAKFLQLRVEGFGIDDCAVAYHARAFAVQYARRNQTQYEFALAYANGVACIVAALITGNDVKMRREYVNDFAFAFVAPLSADHDYVFYNGQALGSAFQTHP